MITNFKLFESATKADMIMNMINSEHSLLQNSRRPLDKEDIEYKQGAIKRKIRQFLELENIDYTNTNQTTLLSYAILFENDEIVKHLINMGAEKTEEYEEYLKKQKSNEFNL